MFAAEGSYTVVARDAAEELHVAWKMVMALGQNPHKNLCFNLFMRQSILGRLKLLDVYLGKMC